MKYLILFILIFSQFINAQTLITADQKDAFPLVSNGKTAEIYYDGNDFTIVGIAAGHLSEDIFRRFFFHSPKPSSLPTLRTALDGILSEGRAWWRSSLLELLSLLAF